MSYLFISAQGRGPSIIGPISYQHEYMIPGVSNRQGMALSRERVPQVMAAIKQNLDYLKSVMREAYGEA